MATQLTLEVTPRELTGSGSVGRMRRNDDEVPGVVYGAGADNVNISLSTRVLSKAMQSDTFLSQIIELQMNDNAERVVVRDVQRHPANEAVTHIDFLRIREDREIQVAVPIRFVNEDNCVGVRLGGGTITKNLIEVEVSCLPRDLPESIVVDMETIDVGSAVHLSGLALPEGVTITGLGTSDDTSRDLPVVSVSILRAQLDEEEAVEGEELAVTEEGEAVTEEAGEAAATDDAADE